MNTPDPRAALVERLKGWSTAKPGTFNLDPSQWLVDKGVWQQIQNDCAEAARALSLTHEQESEHG